MGDEGCEFGKDASAYWDGELDAGHRRAFEAHLRACAACRRELAAVSRVDALLRAADPARAGAPPDGRSIRTRRLLVAGAAVVIAAASWIALRRVGVEPQKPEPPSSGDVASADVGPRPPEEAVGVPEMALEIRTAAEDWPTLRRLATEALVALASPGVEAGAGLERVRSRIGLSSNVLPEALSSVPDSAFPAAASAVVELGGVSGAQSVVEEAERRGMWAEGARALAGARDAAASAVATKAIERFISAGHARLDCLLALGSLDDPRARDALIAALEAASDESERESVVRGLADSKSATVVGTLARLGQAGIAPPIAREGLGSRSAEALAWVRARAEREPGVHFATEALASRGVVEAIDRLLALIESGGDAALSALAGAGDGATPRLRRRLRSGDRATRKAAARALARIGTNAAVDALCAAAQSSPDRDLVEALGATASPRAVRALRSLLERRDLAASANESLAVIPGPAALDALLAASERSPLQGLAIDAIASRHEDEAITGLLGLLRRGEADALVIPALVRIGDPRAIPALESLRACSGVAEQAVEAVRALRAGRT